MPPELWLSANELKRPTRACVISILIVSIRILYNLNGFGEWEVSLSRSSGLSSSIDQRGQRRKPASDSDMHDDTGQERKAGSTKTCGGLQSELDAGALLLGLEAKYDELAVANEYSKDLPTYLQYCKDVVFSGLEPSVDDHEEEKIIDDLWDFYQKKEDVRRMEAHATGPSGRSTGLHKRSNADDICIPKEAKKFCGSGCTSSNSLDEGIQDDELDDSMSSKNSSHTDHSTCSAHQSLVASKEERVRRLRSNMEENRFRYIKPREVNRRKRLRDNDYLHYVRKRDDGAFAYAAHAEYYILLRACARVVELDARSLRGAVMSFEKRLEWLEKKLDHCLGVLLSIDHVCEFCSDDIEQDVPDDPLGFSNPNL